LTRAREIDRNADALSFLVGILATVGRLDEAREVAAEALLLDPLDTYTRAVQAWVDLLDGQFETATSRLQKTIEDLGLDNAHISWFLALAMAHSGRLGEAKEVFASVAATDAVPVADLSELYCRAADGDSDAVVAQMSEKHVMVEVASRLGILQLSLPPGAQSVPEALARQPPFHAAHRQSSAEAKGVRGVSAVVTMPELAGVIRPERFLAEIRRMASGARHHLRRSVTDAYGARGS
jgi:tetratricopeptide (TPR) repeat protein